MIMKKWLLPKLKNLGLHNVIIHINFHQNWFLNKPERFQHQIYNLNKSKLPLITSNAIYGFKSGISKVLLKDVLGHLLVFLQNIFKVGGMDLLLLWLVQRHVLAMEF